MKTFTETEIKALNKVVTNWARNTTRRLKNRAPGKLGQHLTNSNRFNFGMIEAAGFRFRRYGVFYEMGVFNRLTKKEAIAKGKLKPQPWFNPVMREDLPKLLSKLQDQFSDMIETNSQLEIKNSQT
jgi:hypothetical protein